MPVFTTVGSASPRSVCLDSSVESAGVRLQEYTDVRRSECAGIPILYISRLNISAKMGRLSQFDTAEFRAHNLSKECRLDDLTV